MEHKSVRFSLKRGPDALLSGLVEGYAADFGNVDDGDDLIDPGAFTKTIAENGGRWKMGWQHAAPFAVTMYLAEAPATPCPPPSLLAPPAPRAACTCAARPT